MTRGHTLFDDMILIRLSGLMTSAESMLAKEQKGQEIIKTTGPQLNGSLATADQSNRSGRAWSGHDQHAHRYEHQDR